MSSYEFHVSASFPFGYAERKSTTRIARTSQEFIAEPTCWRGRPCCHRCTAYGLMSVADVSEPQARGELKLPWRARAGRVGIDGRQNGAERRGRGNIRRRIAVLCAIEQ